MVSLNKKQKKVLLEFCKCAKNRETITYGNLAKNSKAGFTAIGIGVQLNDIGRYFRANYPDVPLHWQVIIENKDGSGKKRDSYIAEDFPAYENMSSPEKEEFVKRLQEEVFDYNKWDIIKEVIEKGVSK